MTSSRFRTIVGVALFVPMAVVLLVTLACLPAPVGDPEKSKVDEKLTGAWKAMDKDETIFVLMRPWDGRTYLMSYLVTSKKDGGEKTEVMHFKAWLTKLGDYTFLTAEPTDNLGFAFPKAADDEKKFWVVGRVDAGKEAGTMDYRMVKNDSSFLKDLKEKDKIEAQIKAQGGNDELYGDKMVFTKLGKDDMAGTEEALKRVGVGNGVDMK